MVGAELAAGRLKTVLADYRRGEIGTYAVYSPPQERPFEAARVRRLHGRAVRGGPVAGDPTPL